ncbi:cytochrome C oxidase subunit IV family protein [Paraburkholderia sp.]|uniref:cytochrome C oxidase subunit IV family protein n=1 Tax=Paraburkholderia sp. TaxID=1926495 RepID=UPI0025DEB196|nr:cytochrome C oxidase subunit IV family protein [Paraburkholderia sp.]
MMDTPIQSRTFHTLLKVTGVLLLLTVAMAWLTAHPAVAGRWLGVGALALAWGKCVLVADHFMELRHAPMLPRLVVLGWATLVCGGLALSLLT